MPGASFESETIAASRERLTSRFLLTPQNAKSKDLTPPPSGLGVVLCRRNSDWRELGRVLVDRPVVFEDIKSEDLTPPPQDLTPSPHAIYKTGEPFCSPALKEA